MCLDSQMSKKVIFHNYLTFKKMKIMSENTQTPTVTVITTCVRKSEQISCSGTIQCVMGCLISILSFMDMGSMMLLYCTKHAFCTVKPLWNVANWTPLSTQLLLLVEQLHLKQFLPPDTLALTHDGTYIIRHKTFPMCQYSGQNLRLSKTKSKFGMP